MNPISWFWIVWIWGLTSQAQSLVTLEGHVQTAEERDMAGVWVQVLGTPQETHTETDGSYVIQGLKPGEYKVQYRFPGYETHIATVNLNSGIQTMPVITMKSMPTTQENIQVIGSLREGRIRALTERRLSPTIKNVVAADQIGSFPDSNAAEATQRIPGVNIMRDQGEGRYVLVRGTEARLNRTTIDGSDIPAPEGDLRTVALDVVPLSMLEAIEVTKSITPDMDGETVGGTVNLKMRKAPFQRKLAATAQYGYNELSEDHIGAGAIIYGERFFEGRFGVIASYSWDETDRAAHNFEVSYDDRLPEELEQRDYQVNRERTGTHLSLDYDPNPNLEFAFTGSYSQFDDQEFRRRLTHKVADDELERELKDRFESQAIRALKASMRYISDSSHLFNFSVAQSYARETEPNAQYATFVREDVVFNPNWSESVFDGYNIQPNPETEDYQAYQLDEVSRETNFTDDRHEAIKASYQIPFSWGNHVGTWKFGAKYRTKEKQKNAEVFVSELDDATLADYLDPDYQQNDFLGGQYEMGRFMGRTQVNQIFSSPNLESEKDFEEDAGDYWVEEKLTAFYGMATLDLADTWEFVGGLRYEQVDADYLGHRVVFDEEGDFSEDVELPGAQDDDILMPMFQAKYHVNERNQIRMGLTRTYARARVVDQVPYRLILREDLEIEEGNPDIDITRVWNLDLMYESYFEDLGLFSFGAFYKDLTDYIYEYNIDEVRDDGEAWEVTRPENGPSATLWGMELTFEKRFHMLPAPFDGLGIYLNYTYADSEAEFQERPNMRLPGQSEETGNLAFIYERAGLSLRLSGSLHGRFIDEVSDDPEEDIWVDDHLQWDFNASYRHKGLTVTLEVVNLNDEKLVLFEGDADHPVQYEQYKMWGRMGLKYEF